MPLMMNKLSTGKGDVNVDVQCTDVCSDMCTQVPQKVCNDVPYQTQVRTTQHAAPRRIVRCPPLPPLPPPLGLKLWHDETYLWLTVWLGACA